MTKDEALQQAVDQNFEAFEKLLPELIKTHLGKHALMRDAEVVEVFDSVRDAMIYGQKEYPDDLFSIQQVIDKVIDLGYFSHAMPYKTV